LEGSQAVPASPGKGEACIGDLFNFDLKDVGAAVVGEFKTQLDFIGLSYLTANKLRLFYEPNRLMLSIGL
jgi:hypothetical protein